VTCATIPDLTADDQRLTRALAGRGHDPRAVVWNDPTVDWRTYDVAVIRSTWDYHLEPAAFTAWIAHVEDAGVRLVNPASLAVWNVDKTYLRDLQARGVDIVPTRWLEPGELTSMAELRASTGWADLVLKPSISATAWRLWRATPGTEAIPSEIRQALATTRFLAQPYMDGIEHGEWSLVFFGGRFSHAVLKRPLDGEFRVQEEYGGRAVPGMPDAEMIAAAGRVLAAAPGVSVFACVDGIHGAGRFTLLELELLEPALYLGTDPAAADRFATAILES
jgi:glutathione synthase/RimK-type ligase-like ATP-grasp enzyme